MAWYVVFRGRKTGVFQTWPQCNAQVSGFSHCSFQSYGTKEQAEEAFEEFKKYVHETYFDNTTFLSPSQLCQVSMNGKMWQLWHCWCWWLLYGWGCVLWSATELLWPMMTLTFMLDELLVFVPALWSVTCVLFQCLWANGHAFTNLMLLVLLFVDSYDSSILI